MFSIIGIIAVTSDTRGVAVDDHSESPCSLHNFLDSCTNLGFSTQFLYAVGQRGQQAADAAGAQAQAALSMVSPTVKALVDAVWAVWSIGASIYDYINTNAMEERIHALENVITIHQCVIGLLSAGVLALFSYILFKKL